MEEHHNHQHPPTQPLDMDNPVRTHREIHKTSRQHFRGGSTTNMITSPEPKMLEAQRSRKCTAALTKKGKLWIKPASSQENHERSNRSAVGFTSHSSTHWITVEQHAQNTGAALSASLGPTAAARCNRTIHRFTPSHISHSASPTSRTHRRTEKRIAATSLFISSLHIIYSQGQTCSGKRAQISSDPPHNFLHHSGFWVPREGF